MVLSVPINEQRSSLGAFDAPLLALCKGVTSIKCELVFKLSET